MDTFLCDRCQLVTPNDERWRLTIPRLTFGLLTHFYLCACCGAISTDDMKEWVKRQMLGRDYDKSLIHAQQVKGIVAAE